MIQNNKGNLGTFTGLKILKFHNVKELNNKNKVLTDDYFNESLIIVSEDADDYLVKLFKDVPIKRDGNLIGEYNNHAEELFHINLNKNIKVELIDTTIFEGKLLGIKCNTFIIRNKYGFNEMFRYEDIRYLICNTEDNADEKCM